jgi:NAD dependent epimerase/dehydratase family enzyme
VGLAIAGCTTPPRVWLNSSTATIYAHTFGPAHDESGVHGGSEPDVPRYWDYSIKIAERWEEELFTAPTPNTRRVAMRSAMTMSTVPGSVFTVFVKLARAGLLGRMGSGRQYVSWIHEHDFARAVDLLLAREDLVGAFNLAAPNPLPMDEFAREVRDALGVRVALPASEWMLKIGTWIAESDRELVLKSRRVVSSRLPKAGFAFEFEHWRDAVRELVARLD